jgi:hypothetical protein
VHHVQSKIFPFFFFMVTSVVVTGHVTETSFQLTWVDNFQNEDGFKIERKLGTNGTFSLLRTVGSNLTSCSDYSLANNTTYCYSLNALNSPGNSSDTNEARGTTSAIVEFSLINGGNKSVTQGQSVTNTITGTLSSECVQAVSLSTSGLPSGAATSASCNPTSRALNIAAIAATPAGTYTITVTGGGGEVKTTTSFALTMK